MNGDSNNDWRFKEFVQGGGGAYNQTLAIDTPASRANFQAQYGNGPVNAVNRTANSPSGTDWNATFRQNNSYSPSGTDWNKTFGTNRMNGGGIGGRTFLTGDTTPPPSPSDIDNTFFGGSPTPTPTPTPKPSLAFYRNRLADSVITKRDHELYGAGSDYGFNS